MSTDPGAVPQQRVPLRPVPGTEPPAPVPGASTGDGTAVLTSASTPVPLSIVARAGTAVRYQYRGAAASAREFRLSVERFLDAQAHPEPETMREHWAHVQSRPWIPEGMPERAERVLALAGILHHVVIAYPWKALMKSVRFAADKGDEAADRISVFYGWAVFFGLLILFLFLAHLL